MSKVCLEISHSSMADIFFKCTVFKSKMFTFFTYVPCPSRLTPTETPTRYFVTSPGNYAGQAAILNTFFPIESDRTLCQTLT